MRYSDVAPIPKQMTIVLGLSVVGLMAFGLALSYYKNILFDRQLAAMEQRNLRLKDDIMAGHRKLQYLQSAQYKDKYAKENFGLLRPGEKLIVINRPTTVDSTLGALTLTPEEEEAIFEENLRNIRVVDQWKLYLFSREKIESLRKKL
ncbi:MAG: septum formation initiator family protein [Candidatus Peribacteraceae bacterium]|nr:septum formation initiator family protein [Candidatus Peribacteraceae bacterium]